MATRLMVTLTRQETPIRFIQIYNGGGVYGESVTKLMRLFRYVKGPWEISEVGEKEVAPEKWPPSQTLFILPGGKAGDYEAHLGKKVGKLRAFVEQGGCFFSVCGGSYFATKYTIYQINPKEVIRKERPLALFDGVAEGPLIPSDSEDISFHHGAVTVRWNRSKERAPVLISGGGGFIPSEKGGKYEVLASYEDPLVPKRLTAAVVKSYVGKGEAILSSLHLGYHGSDIDIELYKRYFPEHDWEAIVKALEGTEAFRVSCFADTIRSFKSESKL